MPKTHHHRRSLLAALSAGVLLLLLALPALALATAQAPVTQSTSGSEEGGTGWIPQGSEAEGSTGAAPVRQGSSLGTGGQAVKATPPTSETSTSADAGASEPPPTAPTRETATPSVAVEETSSTGETTTTPTPTTTTPLPVTPAPVETTPRRPRSHAGLKGAVAVVKTPAAPAAEPAPAEQTAALTSHRESVESDGQNLVWWIALGAFGLVLVLAGAQLGPLELFRR